MLVFVSVVIGVLMGATAAAAAPDGDATTGAHGLRLPGTFVGDLPCADCPGIRYHLNLWPDQVFHLRQTWLGKDQSSDDIGRWSVDPARRALVLHGGREMTVQFAIKGPDVLRKLDIEGRPIESDLPYDLSRAPELQPLSLKLLLHGMFTYMADAARFTECLTGRSYPVAMEGDYLALERAYTEKRPEPGGPLMATFDGQITDRPPMEGDGPVRAVVVDRFVNVWPNETCERWNSEPSLTNTYWRIVRLGDVAIAPVMNAREPHLLLDAHEPRFRATVGCNQLIGGVDTTENTIRFTAAASTMMACPPPLDDAERRLSDILPAARTYRMSGQTMELFDETGSPLALFQAVYF